MNISELSPRGAALCGFGVMLTKIYDPTDLPPVGSGTYSKQARASKVNKALSSKQKLKELLSRLPKTFGQKEIIEANEKGVKLFANVSLCKLMGGADKYVTYGLGKYKNAFIRSGDRAINTPRVRVCFY